ncbi:hypothetical protein BGZ76_010981 [Entomortierella beljakovae]|nr:hypothetical protein BGZ76_010981 [Entomortierella beljakovae]
MYLQQHQQQLQQQQWGLEQQNGHIHMQHQSLVQDSPFSRKSTRKREFESDESYSTKKRHLASDPTTQGLYSDMTPDSPGSIRSNMSGDQGGYQGGGYFDQSHYSASSSAGNSPNRVYYQGLSNLGGGTSAPTTPAGIHTISSSSGSLSAAGIIPSSLPHSWSAFSQGSHSSPPTPYVTTGSNASSLFAEKKHLLEAQRQEQQRLQLAQQQELLDIQLHQEAQSKAAAMAKATSENNHHSHTTQVHHDHNDPATWGYDVSPGRYVAASSNQGYAPAGVAVLAAMAAAGRNMHATRNNSSSGMDMDL